MISNTKKTTAYLCLLGFLITSPLAFGFTFKASTPEAVGEANIVLGDKTYTLPVTECGVPQQPHYAKPVEAITNDGSITNYIVQAGKPMTSIPPKETQLSIIGKKHIQHSSPEESKAIAERMAKKFKQFNIPEPTAYEIEQYNKKRAATFATLIFVIEGEKHYVSEIMEDLVFKDKQLYYAGMVKTSEGELPIELTIKCDTMIKQAPVERAPTKAIGKATINIGGEINSLDVHHCGIPDNQYRLSAKMPEQDLSIDNYVISAGDFPDPANPKKEGEFLMMQGGKYINYMVASEEDAKKIIADIKQSGRDLPIPIALDHFIMTQEEADRRKQEIFAEMMFRTLDGTFYTITVKQPILFNDKVLYYNGMANPTYKDNSKGEAVPVEITVNCKL